VLEDVDEVCDRTDCRVGDDSECKERKPPLGEITDDRKREEACNCAGDETYSPDDHAERGDDNIN
jgi:hypothetical protein